MTIDELIAEMPKDGWILEGCGWLRSNRQNTRCCPLTSGPCGRVGFVNEAETLGIRAGMDAVDVLRVMHTADNRKESSYFDPALRARLLAAVGLKEPTP